MSLYNTLRGNREKCSAPFRYYKKPTYNSVTKMQKYYRKVGRAINLSGAIEEPNIVSNFGSPIIFLSAVSIFYSFIYQRQRKVLIMVTHCLIKKSSISHKRTPSFHNYGNFRKIFLAH